MTVKLSNEKLILSVILGSISLFMAISPLSAKPVYEETKSKSSVVIHYYRYRGDYDGWNLWVWTNGRGKSIAFGAPDADGFAAASVEYAEFGMLVRRSEKENDWIEKDGDSDRYIKNTKNEKNMEVWILQNDDSIYMEKPEIPGPAILFAVADDPHTVLLTLIEAPDNYDRFGVFDSSGVKLYGKSEKGKADHEVVIILTENALDVETIYTATDESGVFSPKEIVMRGILDSFFYDGDDLGLTYSAGRSLFKVWSPQAVSMSTALFDGPGTYNANGKVTDNSDALFIPMQKDTETGVWTASIAEDLKGKFYLFHVEFADGEKTFVPDPYAKAVSPNGQRMAVVDLAETNPPRWTADKPPLGAFQDAVIYELHTRDFSIDEDSGMVHKGKFLAFTETGTINKDGSRTGLDHLKALGVTHVHLLPSFDFASVNEAVLDGRQASNQNFFNWGYDPQNYNTPEGSYSTDPWNPTARIVEFKQMVQAFHDAGIRVVMDVVYNHTFQVSGGPFGATRNYFYRTDKLGRLTNGSGCGNEVASERPMMRKFITDSVLYWAREYRVDGFRFDLMGLIDIDTMTNLTEELRSTVDPSIIIYGEPWTAGYSPLPTDKQSVIGRQKGLGFAVFNDRLRNMLKGGSDDDSRGFASGATGCEQGVVQGVRGSVNDFTARADESINYVTAHDNLNLWDKFAFSFGAKNLADSPYGLIDPKKDLFENDPVRAALLSNAVVLTAQGIPFFQAGDEFLRSKFGDPNSYSSPDSVNQIRWENASKYKAIVDYYTGLIRLRKEHPAFRMNESADIEKHIGVTHDTEAISAGVVSFLLKDNANGDSWRDIFVVYNGSEQLQTVALPETAAVWFQVVTDKKAGVEPLAEVQGQITVPRFSAAVLYAP
ncbi:MAG: type I pullulanase [Treponema sp.]|jgi:pullulanase|nr:type I pullulanase [Treponema sp.]